MALALLLLVLAVGKAASQDGAAPLQVWQARVPEVEASPQLEQLLRRVGPNMRASTDYHDFMDIKLSEALDSWKLLRKAALQSAHSQVQFYGPSLRGLLEAANVSLQCRHSFHLFLEAAQRLDSWAVQMWSATGSFPPVGLFDGQFTDLGSYRGCVDLELPGSNSSAPLKGQQVGRASYCTLSFRPVVPSRPSSSMIFHQHRELAALFNESDVFRDLAQRAQYFHYLYLRTGVCVPNACSSADLQQVSMLVGRRLALMVGPVKCFSRHPPSGSHLPIRYGRIEDEPVQVDIEEPMNGTQVVALTAVSCVVLIILGSTLWHLLELMSQSNHCKRRKSCLPDVEVGQADGVVGKLNSVNSFNLCQLNTIPEVEPPLKWFCINYLSLVTNAREFMDTSMRATEIRCLHGIRVLTMVWIIVVHTFQYNEWSGFFRAFESVKTLQNPLLHPIYNANYTVDNFFLMSGLLVAYTSLLASKNHSTSSYKLANILSNLLGRYLRLTPQVLLLSLLYMLLPLVGDGPFWYDAAAHASLRCQHNWWVNLLHLQSFYRDDQICNLVSWWISVDMFYYVLSLFIVYLILNGRRPAALALTAAFVGGCMCQHLYRHFSEHLTPNNLGTVPQVNQVWSRYVVHFFWSPYTHAYPFFLGLWLGHLLANNQLRDWVRRNSRLGWWLASVSLLLVNLSSHLWMAGYLELGSQYLSTGYNLVCALIWSTGMAWIIVACHYGTAAWLTDLLSTKPLLLLSKASFIIYLSHMLVLRIYFGLQLGLLELSVMGIVYALAGNIVLSICFGLLLCVAFEGPCLKIQKLVVRKALASSLK